MRIGRLVLCAFLLCFAVLLAPRTMAIERSACVSVGLHVLAADTEMVKSGLVNNDIVFSAEDFERNLNVSSLASLTVTSLPSRADGVLYLGNGEVSVGQTISRENLGYLHFVFATEEIRDSRFCFSSNLGEYEISCKMCLVESANFAPIVSIDTKQSISVGTYRNVAVYGELMATDKEGDGFVFEIVSQPKHGTLTMEGTSVGAYRYLPENGYSGEDSFRYVAVDEYGNYSAAAEVKIKVDVQKDGLVYADMKDNAAHVSAIALTERGILSASLVDEKSYFDPDRSVNRLDFLVAAMKAIGYGSVAECTETVFDDDGAIAEGYKGYVHVAQQKGYVCGKLGEDGSLNFSPSDAITRAEAAVILSRMLGKEASGVLQVFADAEEVPAWAREAVDTLTSLGVMDTQNGYVDAAGTLTRGQTAYMLYMLGQVD